MTRHEMRKNAFLLTFEKIFRTEDINELIEDEKQNDILGINNDVAHMAAAIQQNVDSINVIISKNLEKWDISRISKVSLAILRVAIFEIIYEEAVPAPIAINEAVELAKEYSSQEDAAFINGVLGTFVRELENDDKTNMPQ